MNQTTPKSVAVQILLVEDEPGHAELIKRCFRNSFDEFAVSWSESLTAAKDRLATQPFDIAIVDLGLPDSVGFSSIEKLQELKPELPIIVLTGCDDDRIALEALTRGAQDYLTKDQMTAETLVRSVRYAIQRQQNVVMRSLVTELEDNKHQLLERNRKLSSLYETAHVFVDNVSHEFRTPLTVIKEYVTLLGEGYVGPLNDKQQRMLKIIEDRADDLNTMVDDMLDMSRHEAGLLGAARTTCRLSDIFENVQPSLEKKAALKEVDLSIDPVDSLPDIYCDAEKVSRVLINLGVNAIKFSNRPGKVHISARMSDDGRQAIVRVQDNGPGLSPENRSLIFKRFTQLRSNPPSSTKGFGLGLNIAMELVDINFGEMGIDSLEGQGSTFWFTLPIADPQEVIQRYCRQLESRRGTDSTVSLGELTSKTHASAEELADLDQFLGFTLRQDDLLFRLAPSRWLLALPLQHEEENSFEEHLQAAWNETNRNRPSAPLPDMNLEILGQYPLQKQLAIHNEVSRILKSSETVRV